MVVSMVVKEGKGYAIGICYANTAVDEVKLSRASTWIPCFACWITNVNKHTKIASASRISAITHVSHVTGKNNMYAR